MEKLYCVLDMYNVNLLLIVSLFVWIIQLFKKVCFCPVECFKQNNKNLFSNSIMFKINNIYTFNKQKKTFKKNSSFLLFKYIWYCTSLRQAVALFVFLINFFSKSAGWIQQLCLSTLYTVADIFPNLPLVLFYITKIEKNFCFC